ncbi:MAG: hypothetical protein R3F49_12850 [Planctomycetota bacterium]
MIPTILLSAALLVGAAGTATGPASTLLVRASVDSYADLAQEYEAALTAWQAEVQATEDRAARTELRRNHPVKAFVARFEALAKSGEGQATLWLASHVRETGVTAGQRGPIVTAYFETLFAQHVDAAWFGDAIAALMSESKVDDAVKQRMLRKAVGEAKVVTTLAPAKFALGRMLFEDDGTKAEGKALLEAVANDYAKTSWGTAAKAMFITDADLEVGKVAPDFFGQTIDGFGFNLSDYRGKVVLVDFYGFW